MKLETNIKPNRKEKTVFKAISNALRDAKANQVSEAGPIVLKALAKAEAAQDVFFEPDDDQIVFRRISGGQVGYKVLATLKFDSNEEE